MLVWVASYPRSGNTFALATLYEAFGAKRGVDAPGPEWSELLGAPTIRDLAVARADPEPVFVKTHKRPVGNAPAIYLVRDGRDATTSYAHYLKARRAEYSEWAIGRIARMLIRGYRAGRRPRTWGESVALWMPRPRTVTVRFEELIQDPVSVLGGALDSLGLAHSASGPAPGFAELRERAPAVFRRGQVGSWRDELSPAIEELFWTHHGDAMRAAGYEREHPSRGATTTRLSTSPRA